MDAVANLETRIKNIGNSEGIDEKRLKNLSTKFRILKNELSNKYD